MNLYVWHDPYHVNYGSSQIAVLANTLCEARNLVRESVNVHTQFPLSHRLGKGVELGDPDIVIREPGILLSHWEE